MRVAFTICSNNYLAQAKTLGDSVIKHNPDYKFMIFLCDEKNAQIDYSFFDPHPIFEAKELCIDKFKNMVKMYNIIELNTAIKPFVFKYIYENYSEAETVIYLDPDTCVFNNFSSIESDLETNSIIITPHIYTPIEIDGKEPTENTFTQHGIFNLGFLATKRDENTFEMLDWWMKRLAINCFSRAHEGIFVDQLPMNFAPIFFKGVKISEDWGLNMAPWNLHERDLNIKDEKYYVNNKYPLTFYHFSNCYPLDKNLLSTYYTRITFDGHPTLKKAYDAYKDEVIKNNYELFSTINCAYTSNNNKKRGPLKLSTLSKILNYIKQYPFFIFRKDFWV